MDKSRGCLTSGGEGGVGVSVLGAAPAAGRVWEQGERDGARGKAAAAPDCALSLHEAVP